MARTQEEILRDLRNVECELSPENLHCDGEISRSAAKRKERVLLSVQKALIAELGREPSFNELWGI